MFNKKVIFTTLFLFISIQAYALYYQGGFDDGQDAVNNQGSVTINTAISGVASLQNIGFETYTGTQDDGNDDDFGSWTSYLPGGVDENIESISACYSGSSALKITQGTSGAGYQLIAEYQDFSVTPGRTYDYSFWTHGDGVDDAQYAILDPNFAPPHNIVTLVGTGITGTTWTEVTGDFTVPADCNSVRFVCRTSNAAGMQAFFDEISITYVVAEEPGNTTTIE